jgi:hypothetical protein
MQKALVGGLRQVISPPEQLFEKLSGRLGNVSTNLVNPICKYQNLSMYWIVEQTTYMPAKARAVYAPRENPKIQILSPASSMGKGIISRSSMSLKVAVADNFP